jgi:sugar phosphate isomerase/epimerase
MFSAVTLSLTPEARGGPFVFWDDLAAGFAAAARLGVDAVEIFPRAADQLDVRELKRLLQSHQLKLAAVGTGAGWVVHKLRLTDPDPQIRRRAHDFAAAVIDLAGSFNAPAIIGSLQGRADPGIERDQALAWLAEGLEQLGPRAHGHGVPLLLEPLNRYETNLITTVRQALDFLSPLRTRNIRLLCDLFHMNIEEANIPASLKEAGASLGHVHFSDSNRQAIGFGHTEIAPIAQALRELGFKGGVAAEILPLPDSESAAAQTMTAFRQHFR